MQKLIPEIDSKLLAQMFDEFDFQSYGDLTGYSESEYNELMSIFDEAKRMSDDGYEYRSARDLAKLLKYTEYTEYRKFINPINKAKESCKGSGYTAEIGSNTKRQNIKKRESTQ